MKTKPSKKIQSTIRGSDPERLARMGQLLIKASELEV